MKITPAVLMIALTCLMVSASIARSLDVPDTRNCSAVMRDPHPFTLAPCGGDLMPVIDVYLFDYPDSLPIEVIRTDVYLASTQLDFCQQASADSSTFSPDPGHTTFSGTLAASFPLGVDCAALQLLVVFSGDIIAAFTPTFSGPDLNGDLAVTVADFGLFAARFYSSDPCADFDESGQVGVADFGLFAGWFEDCLCAP